VRLATPSKTLDNVPAWIAPAIKVMIDYPLPAGAESPGAALGSGWYCATAMDRVLYSTFHHVHGLLRWERTVEHPNHVEPQVYKYFFGYRCCECNEVYLVPDWVADETDLGRAMKHDCAGIKQQGGATK
jgi:hypothetical protein